MVSKSVNVVHGASLGLEVEPLFMGGEASIVKQINLSGVWCRWSMDLATVPKERRREKVM